jgi:hypothetical protein
MSDHPVPSETEAIRKLQQLKAEREKAVRRRFPTPTDAADWLLARLRDLNRSWDSENALAALPDLVAWLHDGMWAAAEVLRPIAKLAIGQPPPAWLVAMAYVRGSEADEFLSGLDLLLNLAERLPTPGVFECQLNAVRQLPTRVGEYVPAKMHIPPRAIGEDVTRILRGVPLAQLGATVHREIRMAAAAASMQAPPSPKPVGSSGRAPNPDVERECRRLGADARVFSRPALQTALAERMKADAPGHATIDMSLVALKKRGLLIPAGRGRYRWNFSHI